MENVRTRIFKVDALSPDLSLVEEAANVIRRGGLVVFPTETVYGLGAGAYSAESVTRIFRAKGRPIDNPLIVHICELSELIDVAEDVPEWAYVIAERLWPGPITVIVKRSGRIPDAVSAGLPTVAVRMPAHPVALKLIGMSGVPIAAPSANLAGRPSPTIPQHAIKDMYGRADVIIDAGETFLGVESTIVDVTRRPPVLLRPGPISVEDIGRLLEVDVVVPEFAKGLEEAEMCISPGTKYRHYAPETPMVVVESDAYDDYEGYARGVMGVASELLSRGLRICVVASSETSKFYEGLGVNVLELGSRNCPYEVAKNLFKTLRLIDDIRVDVAVCEGFEERGLGLAIMNRLRKASGYKFVKVSQGSCP